MLRLNLRVGKKRIGWIYHYYSGKFDYANMLPWAIKDYAILPENAPVDFLVLCAWPFPPAPGDPPIPAEFTDFKGPRFILSGEPHRRYPNFDNCFQFVNGIKPDDGPNIRYSPGMGYWSPPLESENKPNRCCVIDSGKWPWRVELIKQTAAVLGGVHGFGKIVGQPVGGYHNDDQQCIFGNAKCRALTDFAFNICIESFQLADYWTEKIADPILCETVPIYQGSPNIYDYFIPESLILREDAAKVDWNQWQAEYAKRRPYVLQQKQLLLTKFNIFSYFNLLTDDLSLLDKQRPIVR